LEEEFSDGRARLWMGLSANGVGEVWAMFILIRIEVGLIKNILPLARRRGRGCTKKFVTGDKGFTHGNTQKSTRKEDVRKAM